MCVCLCACVWGYAGVCVCVYFAGEEAECTLPHSMIHFWLQSDESQNPTGVPNSRFTASVPSLTLHRFPSQDKKHIFDQISPAHMEPLIVPVKETRLTKKKLTAV